MNSPQAFDEEKYERLLGGLECSEVMLSEILYRNRSDSEYYKKIYIENEKILTDIKNFKLKKHFKITDGEHGSAEYLESGVKYLTAENIKQGYVDITNVKYVSEQVHIRNKRAAVNENDILISIKGTLGEVALAEKSLIPCNMNRDVAIMKSLNKTTSLNCLVSIFLMTKYGRIQSLREGSGGVQQMITLERLREFNVPLLQENFCLELQKCHKNFLALRDKSKSAYTSAETLLLKTLNLQNFEPSKENTSVKTFAETFASGRLDAEYYQKKYDEIEERIKSCKYGYSTIEKYFNPVKDDFDRKEKSYPYIEIGNVNVGTATAEHNIIHTEDLPDNAKIKVKEGDILISKVRPNRGAVTIVKDIPNLIVSGAFCVLRSKGTYSTEALLVLLRTAIYKKWLLKWNVGTSYPVIKDKDVYDLPLPLLPQNIQQQISAKVKEAFALREQSKQLLKAATKAVEIAIEEGEAAALKYLEAQAKENV